MAGHVPAESGVPGVAEEVVHVRPQPVAPDQGDELFAQAREDPILAGRGEAGGDVHRFLARGRAVEPDTSLALEPLHPGVQGSPEDHPPVCGQELLAPVAS